MEIVPIGAQCSSLEKLHISSCRKLSKIGHGLSTSICLEELKLSDCPNLSSIPDLEGLSSLQILDISMCENLEIVPIGVQLSSLQKLHISSCRKLSKIGDGLSNSYFLEESKSSDCPNSSSIPDLKEISFLQILDISNCENLEIVSIGGQYSYLEILDIRACAKLSHIGSALSIFASLRKLRIVNCPNLRSIPRILHGYITELDFTGLGKSLSCLLPDLLQSNTLVRNLTLSDLPDLRSIPESVEKLHFLHHLTIKRCPTLRSIPNDCLGSLTCLRRLDIGGFSEELEEFPGFDSIRRLSASLKELRLRGWAKLSSLPYQLQHLTALEELEIQRFHGIEALPDWLGNLSSIKRLRIDSCDKLVYLPSELVRRSLSKVIAFEISACPRLEARRSKESSSEGFNTVICRTPSKRK
ncbi:hypothetical protein Goshw_019579, partial [Gossypium schwendimanii]|nr:hypothetical protein [Gossypium schwendimanii]